MERLDSFEIGSTLGRVGDRYDPDDFQLLRNQSLVGQSINSSLLQQYLGILDRLELRLRTK